MSKLRLSRRSLIVAMAVVSGAGIVHRSSGGNAQAAMSGGQVPFFYRFKLGDLEGTVVSDGSLGPLPSSALYSSAPKEDLAKLLADAFVGEQIAPDENVLVLKLGDRQVLFDTGVGEAKIFGPNGGQLLKNLAAAGIEAGSISAVVLTHAHPDHCWQLVSASGAANFPNAQIFMTEADFNFWTDEGNLSIDAIKGMVEGTRKILPPLKDRITFIQDGKEVLPGIQAMFTPGHTVGHVSYVLTTGGQSLFLIGDVVHHHIVSMERPKYAFGFDTDPNLGIETRLKTLDMLATNRMPILSFHLSWPGIGHVGRSGDAFRFHPLPMRMTL